MYLKEIPILGERESWRSRTFPHSSDSLVGHLAG